MPDIIEGRRLTISTKRADNSQAPATACTQVPRTLADLLEPIPTDRGNQLSMLRRTADLIAEYRREPTELVDIHQLLAMRDASGEPGGFRAFLIGKKYKGNSPASYNNYLGVLIRRAESRGWAATEDVRSASAVIRKAWEPIFGHFRGTAKAYSKQIRYT